MEYEEWDECADNTYDEGILDLSDEAQYQYEAQNAEWVKLPIRAWSEWESMRVPWTADDKLDTWEFIQSL